MAPEIDDDVSTEVLQDIGQDRRLPNPPIPDYGTSTGGLFEWALTTMKANMIVKRKGWDFAIRLDDYKRDIVDAKTGEMLELTTADLLARDWGVA